MTLKQAFFILRHGSYEGRQKYLEAVKVIEDEYNRQKAEIEEYRNTAELVLKEVQKVKALWEKDMAKARAEAVKEFAERLVAIYENDKTYERPNAHTLVMTLFCKIDNLVKEFTEGE